jgi:hypothetical protein
MLTDEAKVALNQAKPQEGVSLVVFVHPNIDMASLRSVKDVKQRASQLGRIYRDAKQPIVDQVSAYADEGLRVIQSGDGAPHILLFGPAKAWRHLFKNHQALFGGSNVEVVANNMIGTAI